MFEYVWSPDPDDSYAGILSAAFEGAMNAPTPTDATSALMESLGKSFGAKRAYIYQLMPGSSEFTCACEWCAPGVEPMSDVTHGLSMSMASRWFGDGDNRSLLAIRNLEEVALVNPEYARLFRQRSMKSQVLGKLMRGRHPLGTLGFDDPDPDKFDELCRLMYPICAFAASAVNSANLLGRIRMAGMVDKLTGAGTRMSFYQKAEQLSPNVCIGMAYLDIAGLQGVNDVKGHEAGDELLKAVRGTLISEFHDDQVYRMGTDEFLVVAPGMAEELFRGAMERIRARLDELSAFVALGVCWQDRLGPNYDSMVRHAWLDCSNEKREWERRGGKRLGEELEEPDLGIQPVHAKSGDDFANGEGLDIPCYRNDEFFRRARIWIEHTSASGVAMVALDINYFKLYNDIFGRRAGDALIEGYATGITRFASKRRGIAGYLGSDSFAVTFPVDGDLGQEALRSMLELEFGRLEVSEGFAASVGVVVTEDLDVGVTIMYDRALVALQEVKGNYTNHISFYDEGRYERERENQLLLIEAQNGLKKGEFTFYLQPKVDIVTNKVVSAEALVRWIHDGEVVPPYKFIELMEHSGYIFALDRYVWESVCAWQRSLLDRGIEPVPISVNVSRVDFYFADLANHFSSLVERYELPTRLVGIEVTESAYSKDAELINNVIRRMQQAGFLVFMDDFGSGYSSLHMLRSVAVDVLNMDKGFIDNADMHDGSDAIISNVIKMAHMMGLPVISEGVETREQRDSLRSMDCDYVQGYYYYKPMTIEEFEEILKKSEAVELDHSDNVILALTSSGVPMSKV